VIVTLASYNIHKAEGLDRRVDLPRIAHVLKEIDADLIGVQEVYRPQAEALADSLGMRMIMGATLSERGLAYGNAVLTRLAIQASYTFDLSRPDRQPRGACGSIFTWPGVRSICSTSTSDSRFASAWSRWPRWYGSRS
jgi:endonuclease/exonuclease/phosphatase family metal-dependent hydrolase